MSGAQNLIDIVSDQCLKNGLRKFEPINIKAERASGIMPDALSQIEIKYDK